MHNKKKTRRCCFFFRFSRSAGYCRDRSAGGLTLATPARHCGWPARYSTSQSAYYSAGPLLSATGPLPSASGIIQRRPAAICESCVLPRLVGLLLRTVHPTHYLLLRPADLLLLRPAVHCLLLLVTSRPTARGWSPYRHRRLNLPLRTIRCPTASGQMPLLRPAGCSIARDQFTTRDRLTIAAGRPTSATSLLPATGLLLQPVGLLRRPVCYPRPTYYCCDRPAYYLRPAGLILRLAGQLLRPVYYCDRPAHYLRLAGQLLRPA
jgi:hypothetical protein